MEKNIYELDFEHYFQISDIHELKEILKDYMYIPFISASVLYNIGSTYTGFFIELMNINKESHLTLLGYLTCKHSKRISYQYLRNIAKYVYGYYGNNVYSFMMNKNIISHFNITVYLVGIYYILVQKINSIVDKMLFETSYNKMILSISDFLQNDINENINIISLFLNSIHLKNSIKYINIENNITRLDNIINNGKIEYNIRIDKLKSTLNIALIHSNFQERMNFINFIENTKINDEIDNYIKNEYIIRELCLHIYTYAEDFTIFG